MDNKSFDDDDTSRSESPGGQSNSGINTHIDPSRQKEKHLRRPLGSNTSKDDRIEYHDVIPHTPAHISGDRKELQGVESQTVAKQRNKKYSQMFHEPLSNLAPISGYNKKNNEAILLVPSAPVVPRTMRQVSFTGDTNVMYDDAALNRTTKLPHADIDRTPPRALFVELLELRAGSGDGGVFRETARWIRFEEDVEEVAGRWSKPHAASLSFHSLTNLRLCLQRAVFLLDHTDADDFTQVVRDIVSKSGEHFDMNQLQMATLRLALLKRRQHFIHNSYVDALTSNSGHGPGQFLRMFSSTRGRNLPTAARKISTTLQSWLPSSGRQQQQQPSQVYGNGGYKISTVSISPEVNEMPSGSLGAPRETFGRSETVGGAVAHGSDDELRKRSRVSDSHSTHNSYLDEADYSNVVINTDYLKYLPSGCESCVVLAGECAELEQIVAAFVRLEEPRHMPGMLEVPVPVRFVLVLIGPPQTMLSYHQVGRCWATLMANGQFQDTAYRASDKQDILNAMNEFLDFSVVLPPDRLDDSLLALAHDDAWKFQHARFRKNLFEKQQRKISVVSAQSFQQHMRGKKSEATVSSFSAAPHSLHVVIGGKASTASTMEVAGDGPPPTPPGKVPPIDNLIRSRRLFNGFINDIRRRYPWYLRDWLDGLNFTCVASIVFMFFSVLAIATSFGALLSVKTGGLIGVEEVLVSTSLCGILWSLFACQPQLVLAMTGPIMVFDAALYGFCKSSGVVDFLSFRFWIACWVILYVIVLLCFDMIGVLIRFAFKRFVEDVWTALLAFIYIYEAIMRMIASFKVNPTLSKSMYIDKWNTTLATYGPKTKVLNANDTGTLAMATRSVLNLTQISANTSTNLTSHSFNTTFTNSSQLLSNSTKTAVVAHFLEPNTSLFSLFLLIGTFSLAMLLKEGRNSHYLGKTARRCLGDYGVAISIFVFALIANVVPHIYTEMISVPEARLQVTSPQLRGWFVNPFRSQQGVPTPVWAYFAAAVPAILILIIMFLLIEVGELVIAKKERKLKKGSGHHFDLLLAGLLFIPCALLGIPWMLCTVAASVAHVNSVTVFEKVGKAPGEQPQFVEVKEQRVTALMISVLLGLVMLFAQKILRLIPTFCLYGVFIYLGVNTIRPLDFTQRVILFFTPRKHHPNVDYVTKVKQWRMHLFTAAQLAGFVALMVIKETKISLFLPLFVVALIPLRYAFNWFYPKNELNALDFDERKPPTPPSPYQTPTTSSPSDAKHIDVTPSVAGGKINGIASGYSVTDDEEESDRPVAEQDFYEEARAPG